MLTSGRFLNPFPLSLVGVTGFEPALLSEPDPKSGGSANFPIRPLKLVRVRGFEPPILSEPVPQTGVYAGFHHTRIKWEVMATAFLL